MRRPGVERQRRSGTARDVRFSCHRRRRARLQGSPRIARMWNLQSAWRPIRRSFRTILPPASRTRGPKTTPWLLARARAGGRILWPRSGRSRSGGNCAKLSLKRTCARQRIFCTIIAAPPSIGQSSHLILFSPTRRSRGGGSNSLPARNPYCLRRPVSHIYSGYSYNIHH